MLSDERTWLVLWLHFLKINDQGNNIYRLVCPPALPLRFYNNSKVYHMNPALRHDRALKTIWQLVVSSPLASSPLSPAQSKALHGPLGGAGQSRPDFHWEGVLYVRKYSDDNSSFLPSAKLLIFGHTSFGILSFII